MLFTKRIIFSLMLSHMILITPSNADCLDPDDDDNVLNYAPLVVTAPLSIVASGVGYTLDGVYFLSGPILLTSAICLPIGVALGGHDSGNFVGHCMGDMLRHGTFDNSIMGTSEIGSTIWNNTHAWRCPL